MKRFICTMNDGGHINVPADRMKLVDEVVVCAYSNGELVAIVDIATVVSAHLSEKTDALSK